MSFVEIYHKILQKYKAVIIIVWLVVFGFSLWLGPKFLDSTSTDFDAPKDTRAYQANKILDTEFGHVSNQSSTIIVIRNPDGSVINSATRAYVKSVISTVNVSKYQPIIDSIQDYYTLIDFNLTDIAANFVSKNNQTMLVIFSLNYNNIDLYHECVALIKTAVHDLNSLPETYFVGVTGFSLLFDDMQEGVVHDLKRIDSIVLPLALLVLAIILRSARLLIVPLTSLGFSILISYLIMYPIALNLSVFVFVPALMMSLVIAISIDYSLFLLTRYREEIFKGKSNSDAVRLMSQNAGHTILVSGLTLAITFLGLAFFPLELLVSVGIGSAIAVLTTLLVNLTLTPALLLTFGNFFSRFTLYRKFQQNKRKQEEKKSDIEMFMHSNWRRVGHFAIKYSKFVIIGVLLLAIPISINVVKLQTTIDLNQLYPRTSEAANAFKEMEKDFPPGELMPHYLVIQTHQMNGVLNATFFAYSHEIIERICTDTNLHKSNVNGISWGNGSSISFYIAISFLSPSSPEYNTELGFLYRMIFNQYTNSDNSTAIFEIATDIDPFGNEIENWTKTVRSILQEYEQKTGYSLYIAGGSTVMIDSIDRVYELFPMMIVVTIAIIYLLIAFMFKSAFIPLRLIITIALTLSWIYGLAVLVFEYPYLDGIITVLQDVDSLYWITPIMSFSILIGLGLDYDIFLMSRVSEYRDKGFSDRASILRGLYKTGGIITAAGIIMVISFSGLLLSTEMVMNQFGFILCIAVLVDTFVIRTILVPAIMSIAERWNWWPAKKPVPTKDEFAEED